MPASYTAGVSTLRNQLNTDEELVLDLRPHWIGLGVPVLMAFGGLVLLILGLIYKPDGSAGTAVLAVVLIVFLAAAANLGWRYLVWNRTVFALTSTRVISRWGVLSKAGIEIPLERINTVFSSQSPWERIVGCGDITIESAGQEGTQTFDDVRKPAIVQKEIYVQKEANEQRKYDRMGAGLAASQAPIAPAPVVDIPAQIEQLADLHQRGMLSDSEFAQKKAELLDRM